VSYDVDQDDVPDAPSAADLAFAARMAEVHTVIPARVVSYDSAEQRVDVRPMVRRPVPRADGGTLLEDLPMVRSVPVILPGGADFYLHIPLEAGDHVLLLCADSDPARFLETAQPSDPIDHRRHHLAHAFALPVVRPRAQALSPDPGADRLAMGRVGSPPRITINEGEVVVGEEGGPRVVISSSPASLKVGADATQKAARAGSLDAHLAAISADLIAIATAAGTVATNYGETGRAALIISDPIPAEIVEVE
jgi:hypothetical protein